MKNGDKETSALLIEAKADVNAIDKVNERTYQVREIFISS